MDRRTDLALGIVTMLLGAVIVVLTGRVSTKLAIDPIGPRAFGYFIAASLIAGGATVVVSRVRRWSEGDGNAVPSEGAEDEPDHPVSSVRPLLIVAAVAAYLVLLEPIGYLLATPLFLGSLLHLLRTRSVVGGRVVLPIVFTVVTYLVFAAGLNVNLPVGPFRDLFVDLGLLNY